MSNQGQYKISVIGGTGHIGTYLVPRLVMAGHDVTVIARNPEPKYDRLRYTWDQVEKVSADRRAEEEDGIWRRRMDALEADIVIDLICFTPEQNQVMMDALDGRIEHFLHCGTIWSYGPSPVTPYREEYIRRPIGDYGIWKAKIEVDLQDRRRETGSPTRLLIRPHLRQGLAPDRSSGDAKWNRHLP